MIDNEPIGHIWASKSQMFLMGAHKSILLGIYSKKLIVYSIIMNKNPLNTLYSSGLIYYVGYQSSIWCLQQSNLALTVTALKSICFRLYTGKHSIYKSTNKGYWLQGLVFIVNIKSHWIPGVSGYFWTYVLSFSAPDECQLKNMKMIYLLYKKKAKLI